MVDPEHPLAVGVIVMMPWIAVPVLLVAVNVPTSPVPLPESPINGLLFVQLNVVPDTVPLTVVAGTKIPLQWTWLFMEFTVGVGCIVIV
jgi:hypothetical protein